MLRPRAARPTLRLLPDRVRPRSSIVRIRRDPFRLCPPPPTPHRPECGQYWRRLRQRGSCSRETFCASGVTTLAECSYLFDSGNTWACECYANGSAIGSLTTIGTAGDACQEAAAICGVY